MRGEHLPAYLAARIEEALATDPRTNALDVRVAILDGVIVLTGRTACERRRLVLEQVVRELTPPEMSLVNQVTLDTFAVPTGEERLP